MVALFDEQPMDEGAAGYASLNDGQADDTSVSNVAPADTRQVRSQ